MFKGGFLGFVSSLACLVSALVALNVGFSALGMFDFFALNFFLMNPALKMYTEVFVGFLGAWSLASWFMHLAFCGGSCK